ncbi:hypothetical protein K788_0006737 [Paraburkholderia caribensis MBA4]|uniref:Uncharacterized protein n=1 Tax=Paraburkholderia caribensis MBA4 TaxID=1323664 RepID=A0A0P0R4I1_9BURK|nr:hypothetical protein K788_0006737 [Paraburkholderia caribensis MBA4]
MSKIRRRALEARGARLSGNVDCSSGYIGARGGKFSLPPARSSNARRRSPCGRRSRAAAQ